MMPLVTIDDDVANRLARFDQLMCCADVGQCKACGDAMIQFVPEQHASQCRLGSSPIRGCEVVDDEKLEL